MAKKQKKNRSPQNTTSRVIDYTDSKQLKAMIRRVFKDALEWEEKLPRDAAGVTLDLDPARVKRRTAAVTATMPRIRSLTEDLRTLDVAIFTFEEEWAFVNSLPFSPYEEQNEDIALVTAAAIWMLDRIKRNGAINEAISLLPKDADTIDSVDCPCFYDSVHDADVICATMSVIENRNGDCVIPGQRHGKHKAKADGEIRRIFADMATALGVQHQDVPSRRRFEALLSLIPKREIELAVSHYEEKLYEWVRLYFECRSLYFPQEQAVDEEMKQYIANVKNRLEHLNSKDRTFDGSSMPSQFSGIRSGFSSSAATLDRMMLDPEQVENEYHRFVEKMEKVKDQAVYMAFHSRSIATLSKDMVAKAFGTRIAELGQQFHMDDPYETCFAFLYLLDCGSDLPWLYFPCIALNQCAGSMLPWYHEEFDELEDWHRRQYYSAAGFYARPEVKKPAELPECYQLEYQNKSSCPEEQYRMNLAQVFYESTGCLLPRDLHRYDDALHLMRRNGVTGKKVQIPMLFAMSVAGEGRYQSRLPRHSVLPDAEAASSPLDVDAETAAPSDADRTESELRSQLKTLKRENDWLKQNAYEAEHTAKKLQKELESQHQRYRMEHQELSELRELLFHQENGTEPELDEETEAIQLPYEVKHSTVVFGGHDSWARAIKPMLRGNIRFIDRSMLPEASLIRHAEMVWLQPNSLSHAFFYKIISIVRTHNIPFHYFKFASAEKCARQLAEAAEELR